VGEEQPGEAHDPRGEEVEGIDEQVGRDEGFRDGLGLEHAGGHVAYDDEAGGGDDDLEVQALALGAEPLGYLGQDHDEDEEAEGADLDVEHVCDGAIHLGSSPRDGRRDRSRRLPMSGLSPIGRYVFMGFGGVTWDGDKRGGGADAPSWTCLGPGRMGPSLLGLS
jgi:hypothetical protein